MALRDKLGKNMKIKNEIGFTLVELLVVCMVMGIVAKIAAPGLSGLIRNYKLSNAARVVWLDLHRAKMMAVKQRATMRVDFTPTAYTIKRSDTPNVVIFTRDLSNDYAGITINTTWTTSPISFGDTGTANIGAVTIQQGTIRSKTFTILATGRIGKIS